MELPPFQENLLLYGEVDHMGKGRQEDPTGSLHDVPIQAITTKSPPCFLLLEDVPQLGLAHRLQNHWKEVTSTWQPPVQEL